MSGRRWTDDEIAFVEDNYYRKPAAAIARQLGRTASAVHLKASKLGVPRRDPGLLSLNELTILLGVDYHVLRRLVGTEFPGRKGGSARINGEFEIREDDVIAWLRAKPWMVDRDNVEPSWRVYVAERYVTVAEAFRRGAAHASALGQAAYAGLLPGQRKRGLFWVVPESTLPALIEARRTITDDATWRRMVVRWQRTKRLNEARKTSLRRAA